MRVHGKDRSKSDNEKKKTLVKQSWFCKERSEINAKDTDGYGKTYEKHNFARNS